MFVAVFAVVWAAWLFFHIWLAKAKRRPLAVLVGCELVLFIAWMVWLQWQVAQSDGTAGMAAGLFFFFGVFALVVPALVGLATLLLTKNKT